MTCRVKKITTPNPSHGGYQLEFSHQGESLENTPCRSCSAIIVSQEFRATARLQTDLANRGLVLLAAQWLQTLQKNLSSIYQKLLFYCESTSDVYSHTRRGC